MTKTELICSLIVMIFSLIAATKILSDRVSERNYEHPILKTVIALVLSVYSSLGLATLAEYYYSPDFRLWEVLLVGFSIFCIYFTVSFGIGLYKIRKDEKKRWREKFGISNHIKESSIHKNNSVIATRDDFVERDGYCKVVNDCCKIVSIEDAKKYKKGRK